MQTNSPGEEFEDIAALNSAGSSDCQKPDRCNHSISASIAKRSFPPLHSGTEGSFRNVIGWINVWMPNEGKQMLRMPKKETSRFAHIPVGAVEMIFGQRKELLFQGYRCADELISINVAVAESMPKPEDSSMQRQCITGKAIRDSLSGKLLNFKQVSFQMGPAKLGSSLMVLDISSEAICAEDAQELRSQQLIQNRVTAAQSNQEKYKVAGNENPKPSFFAIVAPSLFIAIENRFFGKLLFKFLATGLQSCAGFFH